MKQPRKIRAFLFDMDGLLLDTEDIHIRAYMELTRQLGVPQSFESLKRFIGHSHQVTVKFLIDELGVKHTFEELVLREQDLYFEILHSEKPAPLPGVREMFDACERLQVKRALVSSSVEHQVSPTMQIVLDHISRQGVWKQHFNAICTGDRVKRLKPAPDPYLLAAKELELDPGECVAFEDSPAGIAAAHAAGCRVVAIPNMYLRRDEVVQGRTPHVFASLLEAHANLATFVN
ncbi:MAG TPA: HAD family phosphatase [Planctomycetota bacterium]|nr:HAD family phosphatase [Planctomycetota bacterium]